MIQRHVAPISGADSASINFWLGRDALVSMEHQSQLAIVAEVSRSFVLDSGAFTKYSSGGGDVDWDRYVQLVSDQARYPTFDGCFIVDKIDGDESHNRELYYRWRRECGHIRGAMPVWHLHESLEWLEELVEQSEWVALGSSGQWSTPGTADWWQRMASAMAVMCDADGYPKAKLHGLRMLNPGVFQHLPLASADSANAAVNAGSKSRFGSYVPPEAWERADVIARRTAMYTAASRWQGMPVQGQFDLEVVCA